MDLVPTTRALVEETRRLLFSGHREAKNRLGAAMIDTTGTAVTTAAAADTSGIASGSILQVDTELMEVWGTPSGTSVTVIRGVLGSTAATHSNGAVITVNPRFPDISIVTEINNELRSLSGEGLFRVLGTTLTYNPSTRGYDLGATTKFIDLYGNPEISMGTSSSWAQIRSWRLSRGMASSEFASTDALFLDEGGANGRPVRVRYKAGFSPVSTTDLTLDVSTQSGLHDEAIDILPIGAAIRLVGPTEVKRNFTESQGEPRRATEVPPGARSGSANGLRLLRRDRIRDERARLHAQYPTRAPRR